MAFLQRVATAVLVVYVSSVVMASSGLANVSLASANETRSVFDLVCGGVEGGLAYSNQVDCSDTINKNVSVMPFSCITHDEVRGFVAGHCLYNLWTNVFRRRKYWLSGNVTVAMFNDEVMCKSMLRTGVLCGHCRKGYSVAVNSYTLRCIAQSHCHWYNWIIKLVTDLVPVTFFFMIIIVFHISITPGYANAFILYAQVVSLQLNVVSIESSWISATGNPLLSFRITKSLVAFYSIWSLDTGRSLGPKICLMGTYGVVKSLALQYVTGFYCLFLIVTLYVLIELHARNVRLIVWLWKPFRLCFARFQRHIDAKTSIIDTFATFLVLASAKFVVTSITILTLSGLYDKGGNLVGRVLLYDGTIDYFGPVHTMMAVPAIVILLLFGVLPPILLLVYPLQCVQKRLTRYRLHKPALVIFMDAFNGSYKDGTNGSRDMRFFSALYFILRIVLFTLFSIFIDSYDYPMLQLILHVITSCFVLLIATLRPYKCNLHNNFDIAMFVFCGVVTSMSMLNWIMDWEGQTVAYEAIIYVVLSMPFLVAVGYVVERLYVLTRAGKGFRRFLRFFKRKEKASLFEQSVSDVSKSSCSQFPDRMLAPERYYALSEDGVNGSRVSYGSFL